MQWLQALLLSSAIDAAFVTHQRDVPPQSASQWQVTSRASPETLLSLQIGLWSDAAALTALEQRIVDTATPGHSTYRQFLTPDQISQGAEPSRAAVAAVTRWLQEANVSATRSGDWLDLEPLSVRSAETLLNTTFWIFKHASTGQTVNRAKAYRLPAHLLDHVQTIAPVTLLPNVLIRRQPQGHKSKRPSPAVLPRAKNRTLPACGNGTVVTLDCIRQTYGFDKYKPVSRSKQPALAVVAYYLNQTDLERFFELYNPAAARANATPIEYDVNPPYVDEPLYADLETTLDVSYSYGLAWPLQAARYRFAQTSSFTSYDAANEDLYLRFLRNLTTSPSIPAVISTSYSRNEGEYGQAYAQKVCQLMMQITARGVSLLSASGDNGNNGAGRRGPFDINAGFPTSCPWITAVGATANPLQEVAATEPVTTFQSAGGVSYYFKRPSWQDDTVPPYLQKVSPSYDNLTGYNASGRGLPDISALGWNGPLVVDGQFQYNYAQGTSMSSPVLAAIVALLNDAEAARGRPVLGFLNPWLYSTGRAGIRDITEGQDNRAINGFYSGPGFNVTRGWDAVTGLGVPDFANLLKTLH